MRVISGSAKGIHLQSVPGKSTRPITDQVKEALFNILGADIYDKTLLDLFGGTGAVGIEALSRGAEHVTFLDINYRAYQVIKQNLAVTNLEDYATVLKMDAFVYLREQPSECFDLVYISPPQYKGLWYKALKLIDENHEWVCDDGMVIVQIHPKEFRDDYIYTNLAQFDMRDYGDTILVFYEKHLRETSE